MADIKTLVEEAKAAARKHAPNARAIIVAIDALAEAHQAEVARLTDDRDSWCQQVSARTEDAVRFAAERDAALAEVAQSAVTFRDAVQPLREEVARLTRENEGLAKDAARLDWLVSQMSDRDFREAGISYRHGDADVRKSIDAAIAGASGAQEGERT